MKWYTCIIHIEKHVSPVQVFHTRAETPTEAVIRAHRWILDGEQTWTAEDIDVPWLFEGRLDSPRSEIDWDAVNAAVSCSEGGAL